MTETALMTLKKVRAAARPVPRDGRGLSCGGWRPRPSPRFPGLRPDVTRQIRLLPTRARLRRKDPRARPGTCTRRDRSPRPAGRPTPPGPVGAGRRRAPRLIPESITWSADGSWPAKDFGKFARPGWWLSAACSQAFDDESGEPRDQFTPRRSPAGGWSTASPHGGRSGVQPGLLVRNPKRLPLLLLLHPWVRRPLSAVHVVQRVKRYGLPRA